MANLHRLLTVIFFSLAFCSPAFSQSAPVGAIDLAGWIKGSDGAYTKAFGESARVTLSSPPSGISTTSTALVNTSKGMQAFDIVKTASVDVGRVGAAVGKLAQRVGPVGMTLTAVSLVCELTNICNDAGQWIFNNPYSDPVDYPQSTPIRVFIAGGIDGTQSASPSKSCKLAAGKQLAGSTTTLISETICEEKTSAGAFFRNIPVYSGSYGVCPPDYTKTATTCELNQNANSGPATATDWSSQASALNDDRLISELIDKGESVPSSVPLLTPDQKKGLGLESKPTRDSNGNVTGREDTTTEIEAVDAASADTPGRVIIKETQTTVKYDLNNNVVSSNTNTSYSSQPQPSQPQPSSFEIKFDEVPPAELQTHVVPVSFTPDSWGSGTCPPDVEIAISLMTFSIPSQPVCSTAEMINPFVLTLASIMAIYIISGVRGGQS